jgi:hypothetical protein
LIMAGLLVPTSSTHLALCDREDQVDHSPADPGRRGGD